MMIFPSALGLIALVILFDPSVNDPVPLAALFVGLAVLTAVRCWRVRIRCSAGTVTLYGVLISRRIPAAEITAVDYDLTGSEPTIDWHDQSGRRHRARLAWFLVNLHTSRSLSVHFAKLDRLRAWINANRGMDREPV
jgi:hypothetical protein